MRRLGACLLAAALVSGGCGGTKPLQKAITSLAKTHGVDESAVAKALKSVAATEDEQLEVAKSWQQAPPARPASRINALITRYQDEYEAAVRALRDSACGAVLDVIRTRQVPAPRDFVEKYLSDAALNVLPNTELIGIAQDFEDLHEAAAAGTLTTTDARLLLLKYQYCT